MNSLSDAEWFPLQHLSAEEKKAYEFDGTLWRTCTHDSIGPECKVMGPDCNENDLYIYIYILYVRRTGCL